LGSADPLFNAIHQDVFAKPGVRMSGSDVGFPECRFSPTWNTGALTGADPEKRGSFHFSLPQHIVPDIGCCIVAVRGYFRACMGDHITNQGLKWPFQENGVLFSEEMLSVGPQK
jgi:hypothetical protein